MVYVTVTDGIPARHGMQESGTADRDKMYAHWLRSVTADALTMAQRMTRHCARLSRQAGERLVR